jgi:hypothetical protein
MVLDAPDVALPFYGADSPTTVVSRPPAWRFIVSRLIELGIVSDETRAATCGTVTDGVCVCPSSGPCVLAKTGDTSDIYSLY